MYIIFLKLICCIDIVYEMYWFFVLVYYFYVGMAIGAVFNNISIGMCIGLSIGLCVGVILDNINKDSKSNNDNKCWNTKCFSNIRATIYK